MRIYSYNGDLKLDAPVTPDAERVLNLMKDDYIRLVFNLDLDFTFEIGDYLDSDEFGRFIITDHYVPTPNANRGGYDYDLRFDKEYWIFNNHKVRYSLNNEVSWVLTAKPSVFTTIFLQNINGTNERDGLKGAELSERVGMQPLHFQHCVLPEKRNNQGISAAGTYEPWNIQVQPEFDNALITLSFNSVSLLDAFSQLAKAMNDGNGVEWWEENGVICFGNCEKKYVNGEWIDRGEPIDLYYNSATVTNNVESISVSDGQEEYATRIIAFGSDKNITKRYRKTLEFGIEKRATDSGEGYFVKQLAGVEDVNLFECFPDDEKVEEEVSQNISNIKISEPTNNADIYYNTRITNNSSFGEPSYTYVTDTVIGDDKTFSVNLNYASSSIRLCLGAVSRNPGATGLQGKITIVAINSTNRTVYECGSVVRSLTLPSSPYDTGGFRYYDLKFVGTGSSNDIVIDCELQQTGNYLLGIKISDISGTIVLDGVAEQRTNIPFQRLYSIQSAIKVASNVSATISCTRTIIVTDIKVFRNDEWHESQCTINYARKPENNRYINEIYYEIDNDEPQFTDKVVFLTIIRGLVPFGYFSSIYDNETIKNGVVTTNLLLPNEPCYKDVNGNLYRESELTKPISPSLYTKVYDGKGYVDIVPEQPISKVIEKMIVFDEVYPTFNSFAEEVKLVSEVEETEESTGELTGQKIYYYGVFDSRILFENKYILDSASTPTLYFNDVTVNGQQHSGGRLNGMTFEINPSVVEEEGVKKTRYVIIPNEDGAVSLPNDIYYPSEGDGFSLVGVDTTFFDAELEPLAEMELLRTTLAYIDEWKKDKKTYEVTIMSDYVLDMLEAKPIDVVTDAPRIVTTRNGRVVTISSKAKYTDVLPIGSKVQFDDAVMFDEETSVNRIIGLTFKLDFPFDSPVLTIGKTPQFSRLSHIEDSIENIKFSGYNYVGGGTATQGGSSVYLIGTNDTTIASNTNAFSSLRSLQEIQRSIEQVGTEFERRYLSKLTDDIAEGHIQFNSGATFKRNTVVDTPAGEGLEFGDGSFQPGITGAKIYKTADGSWKGEFDHLAIHGKLETEELEVMHVSHIGGKVVNTAASMTCSRVVPIEGAYVCFFNDESEGMKIRNLFVVPDQAFCETFNVDEGTTEHFSNTYYWRLVTAVSYTADGTEVDTDGEALAAGEYTNCIVLSDTDKASGSTVPSVGDHIVQLGNRTTSSRQGAIIQASAERSEDAGNSTPYINFYKGIGYGSTPYVLPNPIIRLAPDNTIISASSIVLQNNQSVENAISSIQNNQFLIWQNSLDAPKEDESTTPVESIDPEDTEPSDEWTTDEYPEHVGDYLVFADGIVYKFKREMGAYQWLIVTDTYLIAYIAKLGNMEVEVGAILDDDKVDLGEKTRLLQLIEEIGSQASEVNNQYEAIENKSAALIYAKNIFDECVSYLVDADEGILAIIAGVADEDYPVQLPYGGIERQSINEGIANFASALTAVTSLLSEGSVSDKLLETGIDIGNKTITVTSDNFVIRNNSGSNTFYVDKDGNIVVYGTINKNIQTININSSADISKYCRKGIERSRTAYAINPEIAYAIDVVSYEGVFEVVDEAGDLEQPITTFCLPSAVYMALDTGGTDLQQYYLKTKTTAGGVEASYMTKEQLRQILGRKLYIFNKTEQSLHIETGVKMVYGRSASVGSITVYAPDDEGYYDVHVANGTTTTPGGVIYTSGDIVVEAGNCLELELNYGSIINKDSGGVIKSFSSGYYWRYKETTDDVDWGDNNGEEDE